MKRRSMLRLMTTLPALAALPGQRTQSEARLLGRVEISQGIYTEPGDTRTYLRKAAYYEVLPIYGRRHAPTGAHPHNPIWYNVGEGYVHSSFVIPVREVLNPVEDEVGFWGQISVPYTPQHGEPRVSSTTRYRLPYGAVFRVVERHQAWYRVESDVYPHHPWWVQAAHVRRVREAELSPITPNVTLKRAAVDVSRQILTCFEDNRAVFRTRISSGGAYLNADYATPWGEFSVQWKTPSRHMIGEGDDPYDLPSVPWCVYFTAFGEAIHGAWWHNDFGRARSHGCINVMPNAARWIYRWVDDQETIIEVFGESSS